MNDRLKTNLEAIQNLEAHIRVIEELKKKMTVTRILFQELLRVGAANMQPEVANAVFSHLSEETYEAVVKLILQDRENELSAYTKDLHQLTQKYEAYVPD